MPRSQAKGAPTLKGMPPSWREADQEAKFWSEHYDEFLIRYPEQFVAVLDGEVVSNGTDLSEVIGDLQAKGLDLRKVWVKFITANPNLTLL